jgi:hypothetical protein
MKQTSKQKIDEMLGIKDD